MLDVQTGGAEVLAEVLDHAAVRPSTIAATESWDPNLAIAHRNLAPLGGTVFKVADAQGFPFRAGAFDLVSSRHPVLTRLGRGRPRPVPGRQILRAARRCRIESRADRLHDGTTTGFGFSERAEAASSAAAQGLEVVDVREESLRVEFFDIGAVVYFLRKVLWTVPDFTVERYRERLARLHDLIRSEGLFVSHAQRFLIELRKRGEIIPSDVRR